MKMSEPDMFCKQGFHCLCIPMGEYQKCCRCEHRTKLGLSEEPEKPFDERLMDKVAEITKETHSPMDTKQEKWCAHIEKDGEYWALDWPDNHVKSYLRNIERFCVICGTPRPVEKSLAQLLFEAFQEANGWYGTWEKANLAVRKGSKAQADCARKYFEEHK